MKHTIYNKQEPREDNLGVIPRFLLSIWVVLLRKRAKQRRESPSEVLITLTARCTSAEAYPLPPSESTGVRECVLTAVGKGQRLMVAWGPSKSEHQLGGTTGKKIKMEKEKESRTAVTWRNRIRLCWALILWSLEAGYPISLHIIFPICKQQHSAELSLVKMSRSQYTARFLLNVVCVTWSGSLNKECSNEVMNIK